MKRLAAAALVAGGMLVGSAGAASLNIDSAGIYR